MLRANKIAPALRLGHALEIAERLECANFQAEVAAGLPDVTGAAVERQQVVLEDLDRFKSGTGNGAEFFVERTAQRDRGDRAFCHAICSRTCRGEIRARGRTTPHTASTTASGLRIEHPRSKTITQRCRKHNIRLSFRNPQGSLLVSHFDRARRPAFPNASRR